MMYERRSGRLRIKQRNSTSTLAGAWLIGWIEWGWFRLVLETVVVTSIPTVTQISSSDRRAPASGSRTQPRCGVAQAGCRGVPAQAGVGDRDAVAQVFRLPKFLVAFE